MTDIYELRDRAQAAKERSLKELHKVNELLDEIERHLPPEDHS